MRPDRRGEAVEDAAVVRGAGVAAGEASLRTLFAGVGPGPMFNEGAGVGNCCLAPLGVPSVLVMLRLP